MLLNSQIIFIVCLLIIEFKTYLAEELITNLQSDEKFFATTPETSMPTIPDVKKTASIDSTTYANETNTNLHIEEQANYNKSIEYSEQITYNKSIEYLIDEPNITHRRHEQEVIIKPLNDPISLPLLKEFSEKLLLKTKKQENQENQELNPEPTTVNNTEKQKEIINISNDKKDVLIINLLKPVGKTIQILKDSQIEETTTTANEELRHVEQIPKPLEKTEKVATLPYDQGQQQLLVKVSTTENQLKETQPKDISLNAKDKKEDMLFKPIDLLKQYTTSPDYEREISMKPKNIENQTLDFEKNKSNTLSDSQFFVTQPEESLTSRNETNEKIVQNRVEPIIETSSSNNSETNDKTVKNCVESIIQISSSLTTNDKVLQNHIEPISQLSSSSTSETNDKIFQNRIEPISQLSSSSTSETNVQVVQNHIETIDEISSSSTSEANDEVVQNHIETISEIASSSTSETNAKDVQNYIETIDEMSSSSTGETNAKVVQNHIETIDEVSSSFTSNTNAQVVQNHIVSISEMSSSSTGETNAKVVQNHIETIDEISSSSTSEANDEVVQNHIETISEIASSSTSETNAKDIQNHIETIDEMSSSSTGETNAKVVQNHIETIVSGLTSESESSEENQNLTPKPIVTLEDYAVKQMDFILDHMLLESQEFVAKVLQATGNTLFQRDPLKRYAENLNNLLNPRHESDYSDELYEAAPQQDLYEEVIKKINFLKSKTTKELQSHLPANWIREYQDKKEELKIWLNKASDEMHRVFNFYIDEEEDHIRYLYFNEAFDDIARATEIHQKLALLADLIKIVKNKKQITFMDLYMQ